MADMITQKSPLQSTDKFNDPLGARKIKDLNDFFFFFNFSLKF